MPDRIEPARSTDTTFIYALLDPRTREIRYIGKANEPKKRLRNHLKDNKRERTQKSNWIMSVLAKGLKPILEIIDEVSQDEWQAAEAAYITFFKDEGCNLVNGTPGGDGGFSAEAQARMGAAKKGKKFSAEHCAKISAALKGKKKSPEAIARTSAANKGKTRSPEHCAKLLAAITGRKHTAAELAKMSAAQKGRKHSPATRAKISASHKGKKLSAEAIAKLRAAHPWSGKKHSTETIAKLTGRKRSPEHCANISAANKGRKASAETRAKMSESQCKRQDRERRERNRATPMMQMDFNLLATALVRVPATTHLA